MPSTRSLARLSVVLVSPRNTLNIGAVARAMSNFGSTDLRVADIFYKDFRSASSAVGPSAALLRAAREYPTVAEGPTAEEAERPSAGAPRAIGACESRSFSALKSSASPTTT